MKIAIHFFSGCGNAAWVAMRAEKQMQALGHEVVLVQNIEKAFPTQMPFSDVDFFISPVYFFGLAANFVSYLKRLPIVAGKKAVFWSVSGGMPGASFTMASTLLKDKGYEVIAASGIEMPDTFLFLKQSQLTAEQKQQTLDIAEKQVKSAVDALTYLPPVPKQSMIKVAGFGLIYMLYYVVLRHTIGLGFISNSKCTHCGWCQEHCPVHVIRLQASKPTWNSGCVGCFRCVNGCPVGAIDFSMWSVLFGLIGAVGGAMIIGGIFSFLGIISKLVGLFGGWFLGFFVFQKVKSLFSCDKMLFFADKTRRGIIKTEKDL